MTGPACHTFRREFRPGGADPHPRTCAPCREWAREVASWRALGARAALPAALRERLLAVPTREAPGAAAPLPTGEPLPPALRARLLRVPAAARARRRVLKARYAVAASYLLAGLLTLAAGSAPASVARTPAARDLVQAGARGTALLRGVGGWIVAGCDRTNQTLERLFGRLGSHADPAGTQAAPETEKEDSDGTRTAP